MRSRCFFHFPHQSHLRILTPFFFSSLILLPSAVYAQAPIYTIKGLGSPSIGSNGGSYSSVYSINNAGQIVGICRTHDINGNPKADHAFLYSQGTFFDLGVPAYNVTNSLPAVFLNRGGQVAVDNDCYDGAIKISGSEKIQSREVFLYSGTTVTGLGTFAEGATEEGDSEAHGINDNGDVVGQSTVYDSPTHSKLRMAFLYFHHKMVKLFTPDTFHPAPTFLGVWSSKALGINNSGQIIGSYEEGNDKSGFKRYRAFLYSGGQIQDLGSLATDASGPAESTALAINRGGQVIGYSVVSTVTGERQGFLYSQGQLIPLPRQIADPPNHNDMIPIAINDAGQIIGQSSISDSEGHLKSQSAFLYRQGKMTYIGGGFGINKYGAYSSTAIAINNSGQVLGKSDSFDKDGVANGTHYFLYSQGHTYDLLDCITNTTGWSALTFQGLNVSGQIIGVGGHAVAGSNINHDEAFILNPTLSASTPFH